MAKIKIFLDKGETLQEAEDMIFKSLQHHNTGDVHSSHKFEDPAMVSVSERMEETYKKIHQEMMQEINEVLDEDYAKRYGN